MLRDTADLKWPASLRKKIGPPIDFISMKCDYGHLKSNF